MSNQSAIEWTDATWNPVTGCNRVSAGCDHCYALTLAARLKAMGNPRYQTDGKPPSSGPGFGVALHPDKLTDPLHWKKPRRVFVNSMSDLWHARIPEAFIEDVFAIMAAARRHTFQVLTKRPQRMQKIMTSESFVSAVETKTRRIHLPHMMPGYEHPDWPGWPLPNVWLGTSVENQDVAWRIDWLVKTPAAVRFLSCEPLLGPISLFDWLWADLTPMGNARDPEFYPDDWAIADDLHWVIAGGESGPGFRPVDLDWVRGLRDQCVGAGVPFFYKQQGGRTPKAGGRELDGRTWDQMPEVA